MLGDLNLGRFSTYSVDRNGLPTSNFTILFPAASSVSVALATMRFHSLVLPVPQSFIKLIRSVQEANFSVGGSCFRALYHVSTRSIIAFSIGTR